MTKELTLHDSYVQHLKDQYSAEKQIINALPKIIRTVTNSQLKNDLEMHLEETRTQVSRIEEIFQSMDANPGGKKCVGMEGLIKEGDEAMAEDFASPDLMDAALIGGGLKVENYEIISYKDLIHMAELLGDTSAVDLLTQSLHEEEAAEQKLSALGENIITPEAIYAGTQ
jgi:ferritin-like metal-binding protein YciE